MSNSLFSGCQNQKTLAAGTILAGAGSLISACSGIRRSDIPESNPTEQSNTKLDKVRNFVQPEDFMKPSFRQQGVDQTATLARQGGGWIVITSDGQTPADLIKSGRRFERMALLARERNIAIHPMTQSLEEESGMHQIAAHHQADMIPQFILRVGYLKSYPEPVSLRRPVDWFVRS